MNANDLAFMPALDQADRVRKGELSPLELVTLYLNRIEQLDPKLGSFFTVTAEQALAEAKEKTEQQPKLDDLPPFFGVPIAIKDLNPLKDVRCTYGTKALADHIASYDDAVVSRIKQAGFIILGKTATSEFGSFPYTEPDFLPPARNPWNLEYTPGGSSGGSAAAVAAGLCPIAQGSDGGGSVRGPAFCCGLVGIKPARGRISNAPIGDFQSGIATNGILSRTVADGAALLDVLAGYVTGDPYWLPNPEISFLDRAQQLDQRPLTIGVATEVLPIGPASLACEQAVTQTLTLLEQLGHRIQSITLDCAGLTDPFTVVWRSGVTVAGIPPEALSPVNRWLAEQGDSAGDYLRAVAAMQVVARQIVASLAGVDVVLLPTYLSPPIRVGAWANLEPAAVVQRIIEWIAPCPPFNATGQPAIALPTGLTPEGVPVGIQLVGRPADEATLIRLAAQLERAGLWDLGRPAIADLP